MHCRGGVSRSSALCVAYLMVLRGESADDALEFVMTRRSRASPNIGFLLALEAFGAGRKAEEKKMQKQQSVVSVVIGTPLPIACSVQCSSLLTEAKSDEEEEEGHPAPSKRNSQYSIHECQMEPLSVC